MSDLLTPVGTTGDGARDEKSAGASLCQAGEPIVAVPRSGEQPRRQPQRKRALHTLADLRRVSTFVLFAELWSAEMPSTVTPSPHLRTVPLDVLTLRDADERVRLTGLTGPMRRLIEERFIHWTPELVDDGKGRLLPLHDKHGVVIRGRGEWLMPAHESWKRLTKTPGRRWMKAVLDGQHDQPCLCNHVDVIAHIAMKDGTTSANIAGAVAGCTIRAMKMLRRSGQILKLSEGVAI